MMLAEAGLDVAAYQRWVDAGSKKTDSYYRNVRAAAIDLSEDVVFNPKPVNKPMWSSNPGFWGQMFSHLKTFPLQFNNRIAIPVITKMSQRTGRTPQDLAKLTFYGTLAGLGYAVTDQLKSAARTGSTEAYDERSDGQRAMGILSQAGSISLILDPLNSASFGKTAVDVVVGPGIARMGTTVTNIGQVLSGEKTPEDLVEDVIKGLPNILGSREVLLDAVE